MSIKKNIIILIPIFLIGIFLFASKNNLDKVDRVQQGGVRNYEIYDLAKKTTLRVSGNGRYGSGVIIASDEKNKVRRYLVITSRHNINQQPSDRNQKFHVFTPDGLVYSAILLENESKKIFRNKDLTLMYFQSYQPHSYEVAAKPKKWDTKYPSDKNINVAGFPCTGEYCLNIDPLTVTHCNGIMFDKPFVKGYQLGCDRDFNEGTSGGGVFNNNRELIAIAGKRFSNDKNNIEQYTYEDKSKKASQDEVKKFQSLSWAIPLDRETYDAIENVLTTVNTQNNYDTSVTLQITGSEEYTNQINQLTGKLNKELLINQKLLLFLITLTLLIISILIIQINQLRKLNIMQASNNNVGSNNNDILRLPEHSQNSKKQTSDSAKNQNVRNRER